MLYCKPENDILHQKDMYEGKTNMYKKQLSLKEISMCLNPRACHCDHSKIHPY